MKKTIYLLLLAGTTLGCATACGPKCKECEAKAMGMSTGIKTKLCGEELKRAEESGSFDCR